MKFKQKKGVQLNQAVGAVVTLVLIAVLVIVALVLFSNLGNSIISTNTAGSAVNESVVVVTTGTSLFADSLISDACGTISTVYNGTSSTLINSGNYTQTNCRIANTTNTYSLGASPTWRVSYAYTYSAPNAAYNASNSMQTQFGTYPALVGLVGTIIFLGLVIGVLVASFAFGRRGI